LKIENKFVSLQIQMENFEEQLRKDLYQFLLSMKVVSEREQVA